MTWLSGPKARIFNPDQSNDTVHLKNASRLKTITRCSAEMPKSYSKAAMDPEDGAMTLGEQGQSFDYSG